MLPTLPHRKTNQVNIPGDTKVVTLTGSWGMGKNIRYTLTLTNNATPIKFTPKVDTWTDATGTFTGL